MLKIKWLNNSSRITVFELYFSFKRIISGESSHSQKGDHQQQNPKNKTKQKYLQLIPHLWQSNAFLYKPQI